MRISDWSSDVCSSDLLEPFAIAGAQRDKIAQFLPGIDGKGRRAAEVAGIVVAHPGGDRQAVGRPPDEHPPKRGDRGPARIARKGVGGQRARPFALSPGEQPQPIAAERGPVEAVAQPLAASARRKIRVVADAGVEIVAVDVGKAELQLVREAAGGAVAARPMLDCRGGIMFARLLIFVGIAEADRQSTSLNSSDKSAYRLPSSAWKKKNN